MLISVIVPVYNTEKFLHKCIFSLLNQTFSDFEILLINNLSTDNSINICELFMHLDNRIRLINNKQKSITSSIKVGILESRAKYITFVDSDDWVKPIFLETLLRLIQTEDYDFATTQFIKVYPKKLINEELIIKPGKYLKNDIKNKILPYFLNNSYYLTRLLSPSRVTKIFRKDLLERISKHLNDHISYGEDVLTTLYSLIYAKKIYISQGNFNYFYRYNPSSVSNDKSLLFNTNVNSYFKEILKLSKKKKYLKGQMYNDYISLILNYIYKISTNKRITYKSKLVTLQKVTKHDYFILSYRNGSFKKFGAVNLISLYLLKNKRIKIFLFIVSVFSSFKRYFSFIKSF